MQSLMRRLRLRVRFLNRAGVTLPRVFAVSAAATIVLLIGVSLLVGIAGGKSPEDCAGGKVAGGSVGGAFELIDGDGRTVTDRDVITRPALIYFGYTFCPDVCPFDVARNVAAVDILAAQGIAALPVFVSVDPQRDTPEVVAEYAEAHHPELLGLTGTPEQVKAAADAYRVYFKAQESDEEFYLVDHTTFTYLMMPETGFADFFRRGDSAEAMAERAACFVEAA